MDCGFLLFRSHLFAGLKTIDHLIVLTGLEAAQHSLMLFLHQLFDDLFQVVDFGDISIGDLLRPEDRSTLIQKGHDIRVLHPAIFGLYVVDLTFVAKIMIKTDYHLPQFSVLNKKQKAQRKDAKENERKDAKKTLEDVVLKPFFKKLLILFAFFALFATLR